MSESDANFLEPTIYELLPEDELNNLYELFDTKIAKPFRIRSMSIASAMPTKINDAKIPKQIPTNSNRALKRRVSLPSVELEFLEKLLNIGKSSQNINSSSTQANDSNDLDWKKRLKNEETERSPSPRFNASEIKSPQIYVMGDATFKKKLQKTLKAKSAKSRNSLNYYDVNDDINNLDHLKKPYNSVESKLSAYIRPSLKSHSANPKTSFINTSKSNTAIKTHYISSEPYVYYKTSSQIKKHNKNYLKLSESLDTKIREDLRINRG